ncbi:MAG: nucleotide-binding domain-containing protein [Hyphomonadaceae bacterium]
MPEDNDEIVEASSKGTAVAAYRFDPQVEVVAIPRQNKDRSWRGLNELPKIPKDCEIAFTLTNRSQLPAGAHVRWTVRNRGEEAGHQNDLGHIAGTDTTVSRHSAYNGDHAMDLTVYFGDRVIGRRRIWVRIQGVAMPARNPKRRRYFG